MNHGDPSENPSEFNRESGKRAPSLAQEKGTVARPFFPYRKRQSEAAASCKREAVHVSTAGACKAAAPSRLDQQL
jgi:hypothetical protein